MNDFHNVQMQYTNFEWWCFLIPSEKFHRDSTLGHALRFRSEINNGRIFAKDARQRVLDARQFRRK